MVSKICRLGSLALLLSGVEAARMSKKRVSDASTQLMAGVPVHNYRNAEDWVVLFAEDATDADIDNFCGGACSLRGHPDSGGVAFAQIHGMSHMESMLEATADKGKLALVEPDEQDHIVEEMETESALASWGLDAVGVAQRSGTGRGVTIYVQDTGVRSSHNDFGGRSSPAIDLTSGSVVVCSSGSTSCAGDGHGHGTHCGGTAAGTTYGVASAAYVKAVKTLSDQGSGARSWQFAAIDWVTTNGVKNSVISMSLGGSGADPGYTASIGAATQQGIVVVVAAGNSNSDSCNFSPAFAAEAITVGATTSTNSRASYSNYGTCNNIFAPGSAITSLSASSDTGTATMSGTSMACPHVSGAAALLLERDPTLGRSGVMAELQANGKTGFISGLMSNDPDVFMWLGEPPAPTPAPSPTPAPPPGSWELTGSGCEMDGNCIQSKNHPSNYGNNEQCSIQITGHFNLAVDAFSTESGYDFLTLDGTRYSGSGGPSNGWYSGTITWSSDYSVTNSGWKLCPA